MIKRKFNASTLKKAAYWSSIVAIAAVIGVALQFAKAWTEPSSPPPADNIGAPVTTGSNDQTKTGGSIGVSNDAIYARNLANNHYGFLSYNNGQYGGLFYGTYGVLSQSEATYTYLDYPGGGLFWGVYTSGYMSMNNGYLQDRGVWLSNVGRINYGACVYPNASNASHNWDAYCPANYVMTGFLFRDHHDDHRKTQLQCCALY